MSFAPPALVDAYLSRQLVLVLGPDALGQPSRAELARRLLTALRARDRGHAPLPDLERRLVEGQVPAVFGLLRQRFPGAFGQELRDAHVGGDAPLAAAIAALAPTLRLAVSTDLGQVLETAFGGRWPACTSPPLDRPRHVIFKLHGSLGDPSTWVLSRDDYERVRHNEPERRRFLEGLLRHATLLYLDFDPTDPELAALHASLRAASPEAPPRHFACFSGASDPDDRWALERAGVQVLSPVESSTTHASALLEELARAQAESAGATPQRAAVEEIVTFTRGGREPAWRGVLLAFTANGRGAGRVLAIEDELRELREQIRRSALELEISPAASFRAVVRDLREFCPTIVHFSAHGSPSGELLLREGDGTRKVTPDEIGRLFEILPSTPRLVTFAACYSAELAASTSRRATHAIGFVEAVPDDLALLFSSVLYEHLLAGTSVRAAFDAATLTSRAPGAVLHSAGERP